MKRRSRTVAGLLRNAKPWRLRWRPNRWRADQRARARRRILLAGVSAFGFLVLAAYATDRLPSYSVRSVEVMGLARLSTAEINAWIDIPAHSELTELDLGAIQTRLASHPWVRSATLRKVFPDRLVVQIVEREPAAVLEAGSRSALVDRTGAVLAESRSGLWSDQSEGGLPIIRGIGLDGYKRDDASERAKFLTAIRAIDTAREPGGTVNTDPAPFHPVSVDIESARGAVVQAGTYQVWLGREGFEERWERFLAVRPDIDAKRHGPVTVDLRFPRQVVVR